MSPVSFVDGNGNSVTAWDITFQQAGINYDSLTLTEVIGESFVSLVKLTPENVIAQATANGMIASVDLTTATTIANVRLKIVTDNNREITTSATAKTASGMKSVLDEMVAASGLTAELGPVTVTMTSANVFSITFPRGSSGARTARPRRTRSRG